MSSFNKKIIQNNFSKASEYYEDHALVQKFASNNLINQLTNFIRISDFTNKIILDLGSGTGLIGHELNRLKIINDDCKNNFFFEIDLSIAMLRTSQNNSLKINADIENLPTKNNRFDLILSSFALHWLNDFSNTLQNIARKIKPSGIIAIAIPNQNSFINLKKNNPFHLNNFIENNVISLTLNQTKLEVLSTTKNYFQQNFPNQISALKYIKKIGANYSQYHHFDNPQKTNAQKFADYRNFYKKNLQNPSKKFTIDWQIDYLFLTKI